ncbi:xanthan biosynthesis polysaccharide export protein GumB [Parvularcula bermudensis HTCC2503]|uniref:Xanthan biosynthesis polysaccharide export protein GumB n=2 Tax=Parvularcula TaxID=208215 RepID=E0TCG4_PARBH|nr:xanthan biosynthesis polysaccharide export protein GumB [Parvularcula bermudensis HTCC2503]
MKYVPSLFDRATLLPLLSLAVILILQGCASSAADYDSEFTAGTAPTRLESLDTSYFELAPADRLDITVFGVRDLSGEYQVNFDGTIKFPLIGTIDASEKTSSELASTIEDALRGRYLTDPQVSVTMIESLGRRITVDGSVERPGIYPIIGRTTLLQAVALAGGPSDGANPKKVLIFREIDGRRAGAAFNLNEIRSGEAEDPRVYGSDVIVMDGSEARARYGDLVRAAPILGLFRFF